MKKIIIASILALSTIANANNNGFQFTDFSDKQVRISGVQMMENGKRLADMQLKSNIEGAYNKLYRQTDGDLYAMLELSKQHKLSPYLTPMIQGKIDEQENAQLERLRRQAEIQRLQSQLQ